MKWIISGILVISILMNILIISSKMDTNFNELVNPIIPESAVVTPKQFWMANGTPITTNTEYEEEAVMVSDGLGGAFIAWFRDNPASYDIWAQHIDVYGNCLWPTNGVPVCEEGNDQNQPQIVCDGTGGAIVVWIDSRSGNMELYGQRISSAGACFWGVNGKFILNPIQGLDYPRMVADNHGGAIIVWEDYRNLKNDVYFQRINGNGDCLWNANGAPAIVSSDVIVNGDSLSYPDPNADDSPDDQFWS